MLVSEIKPYEKNAKKHPKKQVEQVAASIKEFGFNQPVVVDKNGVLIVGHGRLEAAKLLGLEEIPTITVDLTEEQANSYRLADNKLNESEWDMKLVIEELKGLTEPYLELTGFDKDLIIEADEKDDEIPETPEEPKSKLGDLYELGEHRVLCGDSTKVHDVEILMNGRHDADLLFTSPPYSDMRDYNGGKDLTVDNLASFIKAYSGFTKFQVINLGIQRKGGEINQYWNKYIDISSESGYKLVSWNVWNRETAKSVGQMTAMFPIEHEWIFVFGKETKELKPTIPNKSAGELNDHNSRRSKDGSVKKAKDMVIRTHRELGTVLTLPPQLARNVNSIHSAMFPVGLPEAYITAMTETDVIDPFLGSGTTLIASQKTGRICYGMELDPKYVDVIVQRYVDYVDNPVVKLNGNIISWEKTPRQTA